MSHTVSGRVTPEIYLQAQQLHVAKSVRNLYWCSAGLVLLGVVISALGLRWGWVVMATGVGSAGSQWMAAQWYVPYKIKKLHSQYKDLAGQFSMTWDAQTLMGQGPSGQQQRAWANYLKWKEDSHVFLLYIADNLYEVVPKAWFPSADMVDDFRQCASQIGPVKT